MSTVQKHSSLSLQNLQAIGRDFHISEVGLPMGIGRDTHKEAHTMDIQERYEELTEGEHKPYKAPTEAQVDKALKGHSNAQDILDILAEPELELGEATLLGTGTDAVNLAASHDTLGSTEPTMRSEQWNSMAMAYQLSVGFTATWRKGFNIESYNRAQDKREKAAHKAAFPYLYDSSQRLIKLDTRQHKAATKRVRARALELATQEAPQESRQ
jgi:hypothetical protein